MQGEDSIVVLLLQRISEIEVCMAELEKENQQLKERLAKFEIPKNSSNSSVPPSKDENRPKRTSSLRTPSGKKPGGQKGRKGNTLKMVSCADVVEKHFPVCCGQCGNDLGTSEATLTGKRQVHDIPIIKMQVTEHQKYSSTCSCGNITHGTYPDWIKHPVSYGPNTEALVGYLHARHYLPFGRTVEVLNDVFKIPISEGGLHCLLNRLTIKAAPIYESIRELVANSPVVGADETGAKVNGDKDWFWTWQTFQYTYIAHSSKRDAQTVNNHFPSGFPETTLVTDALRAQLKTIAKYHQCCSAHLQRNVKFLNELYKENRWGNDFLKLLYDALQLKKKMISSDYGKEGHKPRESIIKRFDKLLERPPDKKQKELLTFYNRMKRDRDHIFTFLFIEDVPPDNNGSERAIRNIKVKQKVSGQFKTAHAAQKFAMIRSLIDTTIKNGRKVLEDLTDVAKLEHNPY